MRIFSVFLAICFTIGGILLLLGVGVDKASGFEPYRAVGIITFWVIALILGIAPFTSLWVE